MRRAQEDAAVASPPRNRQVVRSRSQLLTGVGFGVLVTALGLLGAAQAKAGAASVVEAVLAVVIGGALVGAAARAALFVDEAGITIRNPFGRTESIPWAEISLFRIGRFKLLGAVCLVETSDRSIRHVFAIQIPHAARHPAESREAKMVASLNDELAKRRPNGGRT